MLEDEEAGIPLSRPKPARVRTVLHAGTTWCTPPLVQVGLMDSDTPDASGRRVGRPEPDHDLATRQGKPVPATHPPHGQGNRLEADRCAAVDRRSAGRHEAFNEGTRRGLAHPAGSIVALAGNIAQL